MPSRSLLPHQDRSADSATLILGKCSEGGPHAPTVTASPQCQRNSLSFTALPWGSRQGTQQAIPAGSYSKYGDE